MHKVPLLINTKWHHHLPLTYSVHKSFLFTPESFSLWCFLSGEKQTPVGLFWCQQQLQHHLESLVSCMQQLQGPALPISLIEHSARSDGCREEEAVCCAVIIHNYMQTPQGGFYIGNENISSLSKKDVISVQNKKKEKPASLTWLRFKPRSTYLPPTESLRSFGLMDFRFCLFALVGFHLKPNNRLVSHCQ